MIGELKAAGRTEAGVDFRACEGSLDHFGRVGIKAGGCEMVSCFVARDSYVTGYPDKLDFCAGFDEVVDGVGPDFVNEREGRAAGRADGLHGGSRVCEDADSNDVHGGSAL